MNHPAQTRNSLYSLLPRLAGLLMIGAFAVSAAHFLQAATADNEAMPQDSAQAPAAVSAQSGIPKAAQAGWFGHAAEDDAAPVTGGQAGGSLELVGVSMSQSPALAGAYIAVKGQEEIFYHRGETIAGDAGTLEGIFRDHVTIRHNGTLQVLGFDAASSTTDSAPENFAAPESPPIVMVPPDKKTLGMTTAELVQAFLNQPEELLKQGGLEPVEAGKDFGYRFNGNDEQHVFDGSGVQKGDIITGVNDETIGDTANDRFRISKFAGAKTLSLHVRRNDKDMVIEYKVP